MSATGVGARPRVSVCIRAWNRPEGLAATIASVLGQTYEDFEVVVSDDSGGLDAVTDRFDDPRVRYHRNPAPAGPAANLARVIGLANGPLLAILNDDDLWHPGFLATTVGVLDAHTDVGIAFTDDWFDVEGRRIRRRLPFAPGRHESFLRSLLEHGMPASATVMRRAVWDEGERAVPITPGMVGDRAVWLRSAAAGWPFYYVDEPLAVSRIHPRQLSWSEEGLAARMIATHDAFRFEDAECEALRRARLAEFLLARSGVHLRHRRPRAAWADAARAHREAPRTLGLRALLALTGVRGTAMRWGSAHPRLLVAALGLWRRLRPPVLPAP